MMPKFPDLTPPLPTAADARTQTEYVHQKRLDEQRTQALNVIREAIHQGKYEVAIISPLTPGLAKELTEKGYQISKPFESDYNESSVMVSW